MNLKSKYTVFEYMQKKKRFLSAGQRFWVFLPRGSSKRVSSSTRCNVGSLVPQISLSVMMTCESSVSHSPGPSCAGSNTCQLKDTKLTQWKTISTFTEWSRHSGAADGMVTVDKPHLIGGCCVGESTQCPPWCPRLTLCSTLPLSDPSRDDWSHYEGAGHREERETFHWTVLEKNENHLLSTMCLCTLVSLPVCDTLTPLVLLTLCHGN